MKGDCCSGKRKRYWIATATYTAECPGLSGPVPTFTVTRQARSELSYEHARQQAIALARKEAEAELVCVWTSTQCAQPPCGEWYEPICRTRTSPISQENADYEALTAAQAAAADFCITGTTPPDEP